MERKLRERFMNVSAIALSRSLRTGFMHPRIKSFTAVKKCVGEAYTVRVPERDASALYEAVGSAPIGSILVIDRGHDSIFSAVDEQVVLLAKARGLEGIVIDGCIGDSLTIKKLNFPIFATGVSPAGCTCLGISGEIGVTIRCGDVVVETGQIVFADADGVIVLSDFTKALENAEKEAIITADLRVKAATCHERLEYMGINVAAFRRAQPSDIIAKTKKVCQCKEFLKGEK